MDHGNHPSASALVALKRVFGGNPKLDRRPVKGVYVVSGRGHYTDLENVIWLRNTMTNLVRLGLAKRNYSSTAPRTVLSVQLTPRGQRALRGSMLQELQDESPVSAHDAAGPIPLRTSVSEHAMTSEQHEPTVNSVARDVRRLRILNPDLQIDLTIRVREEVELATK